MKRKRLIFGKDWHGWKLVMKCGGTTQDIGDITRDRTDPNLIYPPCECKWVRVKIVEVRAGR